MSRKADLKSILKEIERLETDVDKAKDKLGHIATGLLALEHAVHSLLDEENIRAGG